MRTPQLADNLRRAVLQAAIAGKLNDRTSEDARDLLAAIQAEKTALQKTGKLKKNKPLAAINEEEIPFEIPKNWVWVRLGEIVINRDAERIPLSSKDREKCDKIFDYYGASGIIDKVDDYIFDKPLLLVGEDGANLITRSKPIAFIAKGKYWVNNHAHVLDPLINIEYLMHYINATDLYPYVTGTAQPKMNQEKMNLILVAVPPLTEQQQIVEKLNRLLAEIDELKAQEQALLATQNAFPKKLRAALLQAAVQGELNERTNENARDLLAAIQAEKAALQKTGKLKKDKPLAAISEEEIPFAIPENWVWVRLGDVASLSSGYAFKSTDYTSTGVRVIRISDFNNGNFDNKNIVRHPFREDLSSYLINSKDILLCMTGGTVGKNILVNEPPEQLYLNQRVARISAKTLDIKYLFYFINSSIIQDHISRIKNSTNDNISMKDISEFLIPLPPLTEQQQIVAKLEALLAEIDTLENAT